LHHPGTSDLITRNEKDCFIYYCFYRRRTRSVPSHNQAARAERKCISVMVKKNSMTSVICTLSLFSKQVSQHPSKNDSLASMHIAESYWFVKNYDSSLAYYRSYEKKYGANNVSRQRIAELSANQKNYSEAAAIYKKLAAEGPNKPNGILAERLKGFCRYKTFLYRFARLQCASFKTQYQTTGFQSAVLCPNGMVFVSNRYTKKSSEKEFGWDGLPFSNIYWVKDTDRPLYNRYRARLFITRAQYEQHQTNG
jgi:hypothetical protein